MIRENYETEIENPDLTEIIKFWEENSRDILNKIREKKLTFVLVRGTPEENNPDNEDNALCIHGGGLCKGLTIRGQFTSGRLLGIQEAFEEYSRAEPNKSLISELKAIQKKLTEVTSPSID